MNVNSQPKVLIVWVEQNKMLYLFILVSKSLLITSQKLHNQTLIYISLEQKIACQPNQSSIDRVAQDASRLQSICVRQRAGVNVGRSTDIICVAQITFKFVNHALIAHNEGLLFWSEQLSNKIFTQHLNVSVKTMTLHLYQIITHRKENSRIAMF